MHGFRGNGNCTTGFTKVFTSPDDAFPGVAPRPVAPNLIMRSFTLPSAVSATHLRLVVDTSQCTGAQAYAGEQDNDPTNSTDCTANSSDAGQVIAAELEAFGAPPAPDLQVTALTATKTGDKYAYAATVSNSGNAPAGASVTQLKLDGVQVCSLATGTLAAGASTTVTCTTKPKAGTHTLVATADATGVVAESNETNNARSTTFKS